MLGRTNITTVKGGTIVSDVENFVWNEVGTLKVNGAFKRTIFGNNTLVAVTEGGTVIYSRDGENWEEAVFETDAGYKITDGVWDGKQFVFAANDPAIITTEDFQEYKFYVISGVKRLYAIFCNTSGTYTVIGARNPTYNSSQQRYISNVFFFKGIPEDLKEEQCIANIKNTTEDKCDMSIRDVYIKTAYNSNTLICYIKAEQGTFHSHQVVFSEDGSSMRMLETTNGYSGGSNKYKLFSFKNALYYMNVLDDNKKLIRVKDFSDEKGDIVSTGKDWGFIGGVYFNKCDIMINANQLLVVKPGEYLVDKVIEDLIDITYDFSITNIISAFGKIYLFGTGGHILASSDEIQNENTLAIKTMSASKALYEAKKYTDEKYKELEERIARIEAANNSSSTEV